MKTKLIRGGISVDARGKVTFINDFNFKGVKRFYSVENYENRAVRAWHGHKKEAKYVYVSRGAAVIAAIDMETGKGESYTLSEDNPAVFYVPPGYYNGARFLLPDTKILYFSTATLEESKEDDYRLPWDRWTEVWDLSG